jgi:hypothetical protein
MSDRVRSAIARNLGVSEHLITLWRITVGAGSRGTYIGHVGAGRRSIQTQLEAALEVTLLLDRDHVVRFHEKLNARAVSSLYVKQITPQVSEGDFRVFVDIALCYGKDTQHIFKALHQTMTVRGRQKGKR